MQPRTAQPKAQATAHRSGVHALAPVVPTRAAFTQLTGYTPEAYLRAVHNGRLPRFGWFAALHRQAAKLAPEYAKELEQHAQANR